MHFKLDAALLFAATASALQVTSPTKGTKLDLSNSDPTSFDIELVNEHVNPPVSKTIATNVQTSAGSYTFNSMNAAVGEGYQINLISNEQQNTGILAQSPNFDVSEASGTSSTVSATFTTTSSTSSGTSSSTTSSSSSSSSSSTTTGSATSSSSSSKTASTTATRKGSASSSGVSSSSTSQPSTGAANAVGVSAANVGGILGGVLALLI
ncbi:hypothetical protein PISL3812_01414 [Talaromyces islandicus]|uniref:Yeast cell wall synthesis Kre9/Knh1-like N-terminal domain-containing protein n=1 Tax=Talaromyces islandicus TaxID=28573 RepID=A0A0U1LM19_TALIS|nr:hypothetical protein PISL3812_01414 [Talaromyces islandicus]